MLADHCPSWLPPSPAPTVPHTSQRSQALGGRQQRARLASKAEGTAWARRLLLRPGTWLWPPETPHLHPHLRAFVQEKCFSASPPPAPSASCLRPDPDLHPPAWFPISPTPTASSPSLPSPQTRFLSQGPPCPQLPPVLCRHWHSLPPTEPSLLADPGPVFSHLESRMSSSMPSQLTGSGVWPLGPPPRPPGLLGGEEAAGARGLAAV